MHGATHKMDSTVVPLPLPTTPVPPDVRRPSSDAPAIYPFSRRRKKSRQEKIPMTNAERKQNPQRQTGHSGKNKRGKRSAGAAVAAGETGSRGAGGHSHGHDPLAQLPKQLIYCTLFAKN